MNIMKSDTIGCIVARNPQAAALFNYYGIDYYAQGKRTLECACLQERAPIASVMDELFDLREEDKSCDFTTMALPSLASYIVRTHHKFTEKKIVFIRKTLERLTFHHGETNAKLTELKKTFEELAVYLSVHMKHEEFIVFPFIGKMVRSVGTNVFKHESIKSPISSMINDHEFEAVALKKLAAVTKNFTAPVGADYPEKITYAAMKELEDDLKIHMHLENNILFPRAIDYAYAAQVNVN